MNAISRLKRAGAIIGVGAVVVAGAMLGATQAHAATRLGNAIGALALQVGGATPNASPSSSTGNTYSTTTACDTGPSSSAVVRIIDPVSGTSDGSLTAINPAAGAPMTGTWNVALSTIIAAHSNLMGSTAEVVVLCDSAPSLGVGTTKYEQDTYITISADGSTFTETNTIPSGPVTPTINITASSPAYAGQNITLTATLTASANGTPQGTIDFQLQGTGTDITGGQAPNAANPATLSAGGVANFTTNSFVAAQTYQVVAVFTTSDGTKWITTTSAPFALAVTTAPQFGGQLQLATTVPSSGAFSITVDTTDIFNLTVSGNVATDGPGGTTPNAVVVVDQRNNYPGWAVSGQANPWTGTAGSSAAGGTIPADNLGFAPTVSGGSGGDVAGTAVTAGTTTNGLGDIPAVWAFAHQGIQGGVNGFGTSNLNAVFTLNIPTTAPAGPYTSSFSVTGVNTHA